MNNIKCRYHKPQGQLWWKICTSNEYLSDFSDILVDGVSVGINYLFENVDEAEAYYDVELIPKSGVLSKMYGLQGCEMMDELYIGDNITSIADYYFFGAGHLNKLYIGSSLSSFGGNSLTRFQGVDEIKVDSNNTVLLMDGTCLVTNYGFLVKCESATTVIPDSVTTIGGYSCSYSIMETITIPSSVTAIYSSAFMGCDNLKSITIPDSVTTLGDSVFSGCGALISVNIGSGITEIGDGVFQSCTSLSSIVIPDNITSIGDLAFHNCRSLTSIELNEGLEELKGISYCTSLETIELPSTLKYCNGLPNCWALREITSHATTEPSLNTFASFIGVTEYGTLNYPEGSDYSTWLSDEPHFLGYYKWNEQPDTGGTENPDTGGTENPDTGGTENPDIPEEITGDNLYVTYNFSNTEPYICKSSPLSGIEDIRLNGVSILNDITISGIYAKYTFEDVGRYELEFVCSNGIIPDELFYTGISSSNFDTILEVKIGNSITSIGNNVFDNCGYLTKVLIGDSVYSIGSAAFMRCDLLNQINIPDSVESIGQNAFYGCYNLTSINIPDSVESIGNYAFQNCKNVNEVKIGKSVTSIPYGCFSGLTALQTIDIPNSVTSIETNAFRDCENLDNVKIGTSVSSIGGGAFEYCESLHTITSKAVTAPTVGRTTFNGVTYGGTLYYPEGSDYSTWLSDDYNYLGYYNWNAVAGLPVKGKIFLEYDSKDFDGYAISTSIDVTYQDIITVNPPTVSAYWINLTTMATVSDVERYYFSLERNEGDDRQGTITFSGYDEDNYLITKALTITQDNFEDKMATSIALRKTSLEFPYEGSTLYMQVDYINPNEVLSPLPAQEWITVEENQRGTATSGNDTIIQVQYRVTMNETSFSRQASITFRCTDAAGNILTDSHFMCYQAAPPTAEMTFNPTVLNFPYTGGTDVVEVTCKQPNSEGLTIESSSDYITGFRTTDTYVGSDGYTIYTVEVTVGNPNTGTTNLNEVLEFSYTDIFDSYIKSDFPVVIGYAGEGTVHAFTQTAEVNADGSPEFSSFTSINCGYSGVTIHTPVVEGDWIILGEGTQQTGTFYGYDTVMNYPISFSANEGGARIGTITFSGTDGLGNTKTDVCTITQLAFEGGGEEDPDTPDIPSDSTEVYYGSIWKDVEYDFGGSENVTYTISTIEERWYPHIGVIEEETVIYKGTAWKSPDREGLSVIINKICQNYFGESRLPLGSAVGVTQNYKKFILRGEFGNILRTYHFVNDWSYQDLKMGLKTNPIIPYIVEGQYCFFSTLSFGEMDVPWGMDYFDGQQSYRNVEMLEDEFTTNIIVDSRRQGISRFWFGSRYYDYVPKCKSHYVLYYLNPYGGWDWFPIMGNVKRTDNLTSYTYTQNYNNTTLDFGTSKYLNEIKIRYTLNTGWIKEYQADRMWELIESNKVYLHDTKTDEIYPVIITDTDVEWKRKTPTNKIVNYDINIELSQTRERL